MCVCKGGMCAVVVFFISDLRRHIFKCTRCVSRITFIRYAQGKNTEKTDINLNVLRAGIPKGLNRIATISGTFCGIGLNDGI